MRADHSPFEGMTVAGRVRTVLLRGTVVLEEGRAPEEPRGIYLSRSPLAAGSP
jgi:dihydroorotase-like cyclic amidohydrolase